MNINVSAATTTPVFSVKEKVKMVIATVIIFACWVSWDAYHYLARQKHVAESAATQTVMMPSTPTAMSSATRTDNSALPQINYQADEESASLKLPPKEVKVIAWNESAFPATLPRGISMTYTTDRGGIVLLKKGGHVVKTISMEGEIGADGATTSCPKSDEEHCAPAQWSLNGFQSMAGRVVESSIKAERGDATKEAHRYYLEANGKQFLVLEVRSK